MVADSLRNWTLKSGGCWYGFYTNTLSLLSLSVCLLLITVASTTITLTLLSSSVWSHANRRILSYHYCNQPFIISMIPGESQYHSYHYCTSIFIIWMIAVSSLPLMNPNLHNLYGPRRITVANPATTIPILSSSEWWLAHHCSSSYHNWTQNFIICMDPSSHSSQSYHYYAPTSIICMVAG